MLDERQQRSLCEFLDPGFKAHTAAIGDPAVYYSPPHYPRTAIKEETRTWGRVAFSGFKPIMEHDSQKSGWHAQIVGQRSDGTHIYVAMVWNPGNQLNGDPEEFLRQKFSSALAKFQTFRDCLCGILRYEETEERDEDGDRISLPVFNQCRIHKPLPIDPPATVVYLTVADVAKRLQLTTSTIRRWIKLKHLPCQTLPGGRKRISEKLLDEFIRQRSNG